MEMDAKEQEQKEFKRWRRLSVVRRQSMTERASRASIRHSMSQSQFNNDPSMRRDSRESRESRERARSALENSDGD
jgi:hypothetical protein